MIIEDIYTEQRLAETAKALFAKKKASKRLDGWFLAKEIQKNAEIPEEASMEVKAALLLREIALKLPVYIDENAVFAGTQDDSFARSYALINPSFQVESFSGYCDPTAVFDDIEPNEEFTKERIETVREYVQKSRYVRTLTSVYDKASNDTGEVIYFIEQVTGHVIPDFRPALKHGVKSMIEKIDKIIAGLKDKKHEAVYHAMRISLESAMILAKRYAAVAREQICAADEQRKKELELMISALERVPEYGARNLYEALQCYMLLWQVMCLEQAPNPYAFSVGNADRIFEPYRRKDKLSRELSAGLFKHFLVFYNVGDRSWAISQNVLLGGKSSSGVDLTNEMTYAILDAYYDMNLPQPILSLKLHKNTPKKLYESVGRFFFSPGCLTPSLFNDDALFPILTSRGVDNDDLEDYSVAGCQEPLIMGRDNGNTTNSWLNLPKILELILNNGVSAVTGKRLMPENTAFDAENTLRNIREIFYEQVEQAVKRMADAANEASEAVSYLPVPFLSAFMGGMKTGVDMRDLSEQGTKYNGSGCLIHGLSVIADSVIAIDELLEQRPQDCERLLEALRTNFKNDGELLEFLKNCPKFGNNIAVVDEEAAQIAQRVSDIVSAQKNYLNNPFRPDWSSPSTHLLYGYWVGATPDGRCARDMLGYGVDPLYGDAQNGLGFRVLSNMKLPFDAFCGGYASHMGIDPQYFKGNTYEEKGMEFFTRIIEPLFFNPKNPNVAPFYLYVNVTTPETLRKVLAEPETYAPSGVYIMRIHGTFVNFLDLSPAIQQDIIKRLDLKSTSLGC